MHRPPVALRHPSRPAALQTAAGIPRVTEGAMDAAIRLAYEHTYLCREARRAKSSERQRPSDEISQSVGRTSRSYLRREIRRPIRGVGTGIDYAPLLQLR